MMNQQQRMHQQNMRGNMVGGQVHSSYMNSQQSHLRLKRYELIKPDRKDLGPGLGPPDFYPLDSTAKEETLKADYIIGGFQENFVMDDSKSSSDEFKGVDISKLKDKLLQAVYEVEWKKDSCPQRVAPPTKERQGTKRAVPEQNAWMQSARDSWVQRLAGNEPLHKLAQTVPHGHKGDSLMKMLIENQIPLIRATWYTKIVYGNMPRNKTPVCPSTDWTKVIIQWLFAVIRNLDGDLRKPTTYSSLLYMERLIKWNFYEGLLNKDTLLTLLIDQMNDLPRPDEVIVVASMILFYSDTMINSSSLSLRFLFKCHDKLTKLSAIMNKVQTPQQATPIQQQQTSSSSTSSTSTSLTTSFLKEQKLFSILCTIAKQVAIALPDVFMSFKNFKELVGFIWPNISTLDKLESTQLTSPFTLNLAVTPEYKFLKRYFLESNLSDNNNNNNNNSIKMNSSSSSSSSNSPTCRKVSEISDIIDAFDRFNSSHDIKLLYNEIFGSQISLEDDKQKILLICEWAITSCRKIPFIHIIATSLLKLYESNIISKYTVNNHPIQSILVNFLENSKPNSQELRNICYFFSELTRQQIFSQNSYARYLISRGILERTDLDSSSIDSSNHHKYYMMQFPIFNSNDIPTPHIQQQRNQRRTILFQSSSKSSEEVKQMESVRSTIKNYIQDKVNTQDVISQFNSLSFYYQTSLIEWLSLSIRLQFHQTLDKIKSTSNTSSITTVLKGFHRFDFELTEQNVGKCFLLMESINSFNTIVQCLLILWSNFESLPALQRIILITTQKLELVFIYTDKIVELLNLLNSGGVLQSNSDDSMSIDVVPKNTLKHVYLISLLSSYQSIKSVEQWMITNCISINSKDSKQGVLNLVKSNLSYDDSMNDKTELRNQCMILLSKLHQFVIESGKVADYSKISQLLEEFKPDSMFSQQDISTEMIQSILKFNEQLQPDQFICQMSLAIFLSQFSIEYHVNMNHSELFTKIFKEYLVQSVNSSKTLVQLTSSFETLSSLLIALVLVNYIDSKTLLAKSLLPTIYDFLPPELNQQTTKDSLQGEDFKLQNLWFFIKLIMTLLFNSSASKIISEYQQELFTSCIEKTSSLGLLFPVFCKLYDYFDRMINTVGGANSPAAEEYIPVSNDIKSILTDPDYRYVFLVDSQKHIESMRSMKLDPVTSRYLFNLIMGNIKENNNYDSNSVITTAMITDQSPQQQQQQQQQQTNIMISTPYEKLKPENVINYSYQVINNSLSNSFNCYWYMHVSYMELRLLLDEWQILPVTSSTPPLRSPVQSPILTNIQATSSPHSLTPLSGNISLNNPNSTTSTSTTNTTNTPTSNSPESILTQFILCHFEQNKGWEKIFLYEKLFLCLPQTVKNELIKLTTIIMESQFEESSFLSPETKLYLFSHILSNLPVRKRPNIDQRERMNSKKDEQLLQESFTELIINILSSYESNSVFLQTFVLSLLRQLNQFLSHTKIYDSVNLPTDSIDSILNSLSMRISFLVPLINTMKLSKIDCKLEEISITLLNLLSRSIVQSDEDYDFFGAILTILDLLLSDKYDQQAMQQQYSDYKLQTQQQPDPRTVIKRKLHEHFQQIKHLFSTSYLARIERQISFLSPTVTPIAPCQIILPPHSLHNQTQHQQGDNIIVKPHEIKPTINQMDPWSLLEDFADTPMSPSTFGGVRLERKDLTYIKSSFPLKSSGNVMSEPTSPMEIGNSSQPTPSPSSQNFKSSNNTTTPSNGTATAPPNVIQQMNAKSNLKRPFNATTTMLNSNQQPQQQHQQQQQQSQVTNNNIQTNTNNLPAHNPQNQTNYQNSFPISQQTTSKKTRI